MVRRGDTVARCTLAQGYRVPDGLLLAYPAMTMAPHFTPSILAMFDERHGTLMPYTFVNRCIEVAALVAVARRTLG